ncbi:MAG: fructosamine kinase family protein [Streptosporangiales bacterium]
MDSDLAARLLDQPVREVRAVGGGCIGNGARVTLDDGRVVFTKTMPDPPAGIFHAEAAGLRWLAEAHAIPVPEVLTVRDDAIALEWVEPGRPTRDTAVELGRALAALHASGAETFGADHPGYIGSLPMDNTPANDWPTFYTERRITPFLRLAVDRGSVAAGDRQAIERAAERCADLAGPNEPPARIHGDLWSGNLHWSAEGPCWLIDPAAHGGHRETDLAMLALFGAPHLDVVADAYTDAASDLGRPLADGWRERVPLHQLFPLLVHAVLFGSGYGRQAGDAARRALRTAP